MSKSNTIVKEKCPGSGMRVQDQYGNPSGSCLACGHFGRLTVKGKVRYHKRVKP